MKTKTNYPRPARSLTTTLAIAFFGLSALVLLIYSTLQIVLNIQSQQVALSSREELIAQGASKTVSGFILEKFSSLETAVDFSNPVAATLVEQKNIMQGLLGLDPAFRQFVLFNNRGRQLTQVSRISATLSHQFITVWNPDIPNQTSKGQRFISPVYFDEVTSEPLVTIAIPVKNDLGDFQGTLVAELNLKFMWDLVDQLKVGQTGYAYVVDNQGNLIAFHDTSRVLQGENLQKIGEVNEFVKNPGQSADITPGIASYTGLLGTRVVGTYIPLGTPEWALVTELPWLEAYQSVIQNIEITFVILLVLALLAGVVGVYLARRLAVPLVDLTKTATRIAEGEMQLQATVGGVQEVASLATAFNSMTAQLHDLIGTLEQRVAERTQALATVAEVGTTTSTILEKDKLLQSVVDLTKERFNLYHSHIYLLDEVGENLVLATGAGEAGRQMKAKGFSIPLNREQSLVARAARERKGVTVNDVTQAPDFLPNPLLPDTRSELAVPMIVGGNVIGVFDVQSDAVGRFTEADISVQTTLAAQIATSVQNVRQYEAAQRTTEQLSEALDIAKLANWEYDVENDLFHFNDHFYSIFHTTAEKVGGYQISSAQYAQYLVHPDDVPMVGAEIGKALASTDRHYNTQLEHRILYSDGGIGYISVVVHIERDEKGRIVRYYGANQDITERKLAEVALDQRATKAKMLNDITQKIQSATSVDAALQVAVRELGHALGMKPTRVTLDSSALANEDKTQKESA